MKSLSQKCFRITLLFLAGLILATGIFEVFLRITELAPGLRALPVAQISLYGPDPDVGYSLRPNAKGFWDTENRAYIEINSLGYRGREAATDGADIVFAGHSLTEALQVEEDKTFAYLAGQKLNTTTANLGISGAPPAVVVARLRKYMPILKPDMIVIVVESRFFEQAAVFRDSAYVGYKVNDNASTAQLSYGFRQTRGYKLRNSEIGAFIYWALDNFRIANVLNNTLNRGLFRGLNDLRAPAVVESESSIGTLTSFFDLWTQSQPRNHRLALEAFLRDLSELQEQNDAKVIVALTGPWEDVDTATLQAVNQAMDAMAERYGVTIVNLTPLLANHFPAGVTAVPLKGFRPPWRGHLNETGHLVYADALVDVIKKW